MTTDTQNETAAGAARQSEVANSLPDDMPKDQGIERTTVGEKLNEARQAASNGGNSNTDNNPYARRPAERDLAPHERRITPDQNVPGAPNPQLTKDLGDGGTMSGLFDGAGNALTIAQADATANNNARAGKAAKQPDSVVHRTINGREVQAPANTPTV